MKRILVLLALAAALTVPPGLTIGKPALASRPHAGLKAPCPPRGYKPCTCHTVPRSGQFRIHVPGTSIVLIGVGTPQTAGTHITVCRTGPPCHARNTEAFTLDADGRFPPLDPEEGTVYRYNLATGKCTRLRQRNITQPGVYEVVEH